MIEEDNENLSVKNTRDTVALLKHMLDSAKERIESETIDPDYRKLLEKRIPEIERKILIFEQSVN